MEITCSQIISETTDMTLLIWKKNDNIGFIRLPFLTDDNERIDVIVSCSIDYDIEEIIIANLSKEIW